MVIPIRIGINAQLLDPVYDSIYLFTWLAYNLDVLVNLRTTYIDTMGHEVTEGNRIAMKYIGTFRFIFDILSLFSGPNLFVTSVDSTTLVVLNMLGLCKISRYFRLQKLIL